MKKEPSTNSKPKKLMSERQKVDWLYYAIQDVVVNSTDYSRDRLMRRIVLLQNGIHKVVKSRTDGGNVFVKQEMEERHKLVVSELQKSAKMMTDAWHAAMSMKNADMCEILREVMNVLGELLKGECLYNEI